MAQPRPKRKGWRRQSRLIGVFLLAAVVSLPVAVIVGALITPLLWKLESVSGMELAGHSGPSDAITIGLSIASTVAVTALYAWRTRAQADPQPER